MQSVPIIPAFQCFFFQEMKVLVFNSSSKMCFLVTFFSTKRLSLYGMARTRFIYNYSFDTQKDSCMVSNSIIGFSPHHFSYDLMYKKTYSAFMFEINFTKINSLTI